MRKLMLIGAGAAVVLAGLAPAYADSTPSPNPTARYETTLVGNVETSTVPGATVVNIHVTNSAAIHRDSAPKFNLQFKGLIVPVKVDTNTTVRRLAGEDHVTMSTRGLASLTTIPMVAGEKVTAKVRCLSVTPIDCVASRIEVFTAKVPQPKSYSLTLIGRVSSVTDSRTLVVRPAMLHHGDDHLTLTPAFLGTDVKLLATNGTHVTIGTTRSTGTFAGIAVGYLVYVEAKCVTPIAPATQWVCTASDVEAAPLT